MPSAQTAVDLATVEDYRTTPEGTRYQLVEGELIMSPSPNRFHQDILWNLSQIFGRYLAAHPVGRAYFAPFDVYLSEHNVFQPDILFVTQEHLARFADDGLHGPPDLAIEVLSPSTAQLDKTNKRRVYARVGVQEFWLVDPLLLQVQVYEFAKDTAKPVRLIEEHETFTSALLPGLTLSAAEVFKR